VTLFVNKVIRDSVIDSNKLDIMSCRRAIHFVLKIGKRSEAVDFYKNVLGMKVPHTIVAIKSHRPSFY